ncbi:MAG: DUF4278 domain-containing protein [Phormidesmis sp.]
MKLTYRGIDYDYNPPMLEVTESDIVCQYRGHATRPIYVRHVPIPQIAERLTYRGVAYQTTRQGEIQQLSEQRAEQSATQPVRGGIMAGLRSKLAGNSTAAYSRRQLLKESSLLHQQSITRSLQHRMEVAKARGDEALVQQLESEMSRSV